MRKKNTLQQLQAIEREQIALLTNSIEKNAHNLKSFVKVLEACDTFTAIDPIKHIKAAMKNYLEVT
ncbi:MAG: hypothetical protein JRC99_00170 [Deltaproteobacteria bacterium]|nr:hypothetical protein [Deltaproteobacteria bacterium]